jgi:hypothetical protein|nr:MAG TPA: hypothetical protein [Ackermannviridae sp.]
MADLKHAKKEMRKWLRDNKNAIFGIEDHLSASFNRFVDLSDLREKQEFIAYSNATLGDSFISIDLEPYWANVKDEWIELKGFQHLAETSDGICDLDGITFRLIMEVMNFNKQ